MRAGQQHEQAVGDCGSGTEQAVLQNPRRSYVALTRKGEMTHDCRDGQLRDRRQGMW